MKRSLLLGAAITFGVVGFSGNVSAATCYYVNDGDMGDNYFMWTGPRPWNCAQNLINDFWSRFDFHTGDWDDGFGYEAACDNARPLARTFNAIYALGYSRTNAPNCNYSGSNPLDWAMCWSGNQIDELDGRCGSGTSGPFGTQATTWWGPIIDNKTELYWPFFYGTTPVERAGTIFHEARHASNCGHNYQSTKDVSWESGCAWPYTGQGAWPRSISFLWWYNATATMANASLRDRARDRANSMLASVFQNDPCFRIRSDGSAYAVC